MNSNIQFLVDDSFRTNDIAVIFGFSTCTIEASELQLTSGNYSVISDAALGSFIKEITRIIVKRFYQSNCTVERYSCTAPKI